MGAKNPDAAIRLLYGPYRTPDVHVGDELVCEIRGAVKVKGFTAAPIPWPIKAGQGAGLIICGDLAKALRVESASAIAHWWGRDAHAVSRWRKAMGVDPYKTEGTRALLKEVCPNPNIAQYWPQALAASLEPEARKKRDVAHSLTMQGRKVAPATQAAAARGVRRRFSRMSNAERQDWSAKARAGYMATHPDYRRAAYLKMLRTSGDPRYESRLARFLMRRREQGAPIAEIAEWLGLPAADIGQRLRSLARQYPVLADQLLTDRQKLAPIKPEEIEDVERVRLKRPRRSAAGPCWDETGKFIGDVGRAKHSVAEARIKGARYVLVADHVVADLSRPQDAWPGYRTIQADWK